MKDEGNLAGTRTPRVRVWGQPGVLVAFHISILPRETKGSLVRLRNLVRSHFTWREGGMTTVWRPRVRIPVPDIDGADVDENRRDESTKKGTKRKRAPSHKGAMSARGEVPLEVQGVRCLSARSSAPWVQGVRWVINM